MQSANGGWGAFDVDNSSHWLYKLPFCDFGYVIDPPSEDVSAHALEALAPGAALRRGRRAAASSTSSREQQWDGSWWGRWGVNHVYGTGAALPALEACGFEPSASGGTEGRGLAGLGPARGRRLRRGHSLLPRDDHARPRRGHCFTNSLGVTRLRRGRRGAESLGVGKRPTIFARSNEANGDWNEEHYTGTGFPTDFMIRYHLYRLHFPLMALGRLRERLNA